MPFKETDRAAERRALVEAWESGTYLIADLARQYGISRPTVYLWIARYRAGEPMEDRSRAPHEIRHHTSAEVKSRDSPSTPAASELGTEKARGGAALA